MRSTYMVGLTLIAFGLGVAALPKTVTPVRAIGFTACGDMAGVLVIQSDGTSTWFRPPYAGLAEAAKGVPKDELYTVTHCPDVEFERT